MKCLGWTKCFEVAGVQFISSAVQYQYFSVSFHYITSIIIVTIPIFPLIMYKDNYAILYPTQPVAVEDVIILLEADSLVVKMI